VSGYLIIAGILFLVVGLYILTYYLNQKTDAPEGVEEASCETCNSMSCSLRKKGGPDGKEEIDECEVKKLD